MPVSGVGNIIALLRTRFAGKSHLLSWLDEIGENTSLLGKLDEFTLSNQAITNKLDNYLDGASSAFKNTLKETGRLDAWKLIDEAINNTGGFTKFAQDPNTINRVVDMMADGSVFRNTLGDNWNTKLNEILQKHKHLNCETCGGTFNSGPKMHAFLSDVEHFYANFDINGKASKHFNWLNRQTAGAGDAADIAINPANTSLAEMYQTINELRRRGLKEADVQQFGANYSNLANSRQSDILLTNGKHIELKNKKYNSGTTFTVQEIDQVIGVKGAFGNINNLNDFEWVAALAKGNDQTVLKNLWKNVFESKKIEIFNANPSLWKKFDRIGGGKIDDIEDFIEVLEHFSFSINHQFFDFIKVQ